MNIYLGSQCARHNLILALFALPLKLRKTVSSKICTKLLIELHKLQGEKTPNVTQTLDVVLNKVLIVVKPLCVSPLSRPH